MRSAPVEPGPDGRAPVADMLEAFELAMKAEGIGPAVRQRVLNRLMSGVPEGYRPLLHAFASNRSVSVDEAFGRPGNPVQAPASPVAEPSFLDVVRKAGRVQRPAQRSLLRGV